MGNYTRDEQQPDVDLGKSTKPGWRNIAPQGRSSASSIRHDIVAPAQRSVSDYQNYGDEAGAGQILYPPRFTDGGVGQADFPQARDAAEPATSSRRSASSLRRRLRRDVRDGDEDGPERPVSVESFRRALNAATMPRGSRR